MGTNYFLHRAACQHCGRSDEPMHIGKASAGWVFHLHVYPEQGINDLPDWVRLFREQGNSIKDEYGSVVPVEQMLLTIAARFRDKPLLLDDIPVDCERGPYNLLRDKADGRRCIGHGHGTWDLNVGEFG